MKAKERDAKRSLSVVELRSELHRVQEKRFRLRLKHEVTPVKNPLELRTLRKEIARLKTWINQKEAAR